MTPKFYHTFKKYFQTCESNDTVPSFEGFIKIHYEFIKNNSGHEISLKLNDWYILFKKSAKHYKIKTTKGKAAKVWEELVEVAAPRVSKRSYSVANVKECLEGLKTKLGDADEEEDKAFLEKFNEQRRKAIDELKNSQARNLPADLLKLLMIQGILKTDRHLSADLAAYAKKKKEENYGKPQRLRASLKQELEDVLEDYREDYDLKKLKKGLMLIDTDLEDAEYRVVSMLQSLLYCLTVDEREMGVMRIHSGPLAAVRELFKISMKHDPYRYDDVLFKTDALKDCRPDFVVEVGDDDLVVNMVAKVKGENALGDKVSLDTYCLGLFGLHMLWRYKLKSSLVLQVEGSHFSFFLCSLSSGICLMTKIGTLIVPSTFNDFCNISSQLHEMYNISLLYEKHCVVSEEEVKEWQLLNFEVIKELYDLSTTTLASTANVSTDDK
ncbi:hypothetical protein EDC96DRAFT_608226, partial [Choanephora cucurbitarum]